MMYIEEDVMCYMTEKNDKLITLFETLEMHLDYSKVSPFIKSTLRPITPEHDIEWKTNNKEQ